MAYIEFQARKMKQRVNLESQRSFLVFNIDFNVRSYVPLFLYFFLLNPLFLYLARFLAELINDAFLHFFCLNKSIQLIQLRSKYCYFISSFRILVNYILLHLLLLDSKARIGSPLKDYFIPRRQYFSVRKRNAERKSLNREVTGSQRHAN